MKMLSKFANLTLKRRIQPRRYLFLLKMWSQTSRVTQYCHPTELGAFEANFQKQVENSIRDSEVDRNERLKNAPKIPVLKYVMAPVYVRNPDVVVEVLNRAAGMCELCCNPAPFLRKKDGCPFLEVHHKIQLAHGGEDTVQNAIALCPNCHRKEHHGV